MQCFTFIQVTVGDPDLFPTRNDCSNINCSVANNTGHMCCSDYTRENGGNEDESSTTSAIIFFVAVIGSLITVIALMLLCINCKNMCSRLYHKETSDLGRSSSVNTVSAAVQTNSTDLPPPYAFQDLYHSSNECGDIAELHIPRCPSYVMHPPKYQEVISEDELGNVENITDDTAIEFSINSGVVA
ncbi:uncharacterized protein LOC125676002 isoform X2 [Ostrea edulis]|uniref:uncharacterized protein LOC125676002 isoform X2 n=1 Tax=Ostrea edulis TaxID=37623 RepID=UPI0020961826|nr:uncharacterized protein LOC125676002 isoform X2 [Ostrea edulis]